MTTPEYYRPINADTGQPTLASYFTASLCKLENAHQFNLEDRIADLAGDVRDHLDQLGIPIRPTIAQGPRAVRIIQEVEEGEEFSKPPEVYGTVMAFFTDAEPDDPRLASLYTGFHSDRLDAKIVFQIPTVESEAALDRKIAADRARGAAYIARSRSEAASAPTAAGSSDVSDEVLDELYG